VKTDAAMIADESKARTGRPPRLNRADEWNLYCYRKSGVAIKTCASMFRISVPTANRIIAKFRHYDESIEPLAREFRDSLNALRDPLEEKINALRDSIKEPRS
jgi:hypothetical protein